MYEYKYGCENTENTYILFIFHTIELIIIMFNCKVSNNMIIFGIRLNGGEGKTIQTIDSWLKDDSNYRQLTQRRF